MRHTTCLNYTTMMNRLFGLDVHRSTLLRARRVAHRSSCCCRSRQPSQQPEAGASAFLWSSSGISRIGREKSCWCCHSIKHGTRQPFPYFLLYFPVHAGFRVGMLKIDLSGSRVGSSQKVRLLLCGIGSRFCRLWLPSRDALACDGSDMFECAKQTSPARVLLSRCFNYGGFPSRTECVLALREEENARWITWHWYGFMFNWRLMKFLDFCCHNSTWDLIRASKLSRHLVIAHNNRK